MTNRIDLDTSGTVLSVGLMPYGDSSGYELRVTLRCGPANGELPDKIILDGISDDQIAFNVSDWIKVRTTVDQLVAFVDDLAEAQKPEARDE